MLWSSVVLVDVESSTTFTSLPQLFTIHGNSQKNRIRSFHISCLKATTHHVILLFPSPSLPPPTQCFTFYLQFEEVEEELDSIVALLATLSTWWQILHSISIYLLHSKQVAVSEVMAGSSAVKKPWKVITSLWDDGEREVKSRFVTRVHDLWEIRRMRFREWISGGSCGDSFLLNSNFKSILEGYWTDNNRQIPSNNALLTVITRLKSAKGR